MYNVCRRNNIAFVQNRAKPLEKRYYFPSSYILKAWLFEDAHTSMYLNDTSLFGIFFHDTNMMAYENISILILIDTDDNRMYVKYFTFKLIEE